LAEIWCSTYNEGPSIKLAAIVAAVTEETVAHDSSPPSVDQHERAGLSGRETEVLRFLVEGLANKEIAGRMDISASMVKYTVQQLFAKTDVRTRAQLVKVALERYGDFLAVSSPIVAAAPTPGEDFPDQGVHTAGPRLNRLEIVPTGGVSSYAPVHQAVHRTVRPVVQQPVSRTGRHRSAQRTMGAKRAAGAGGL
jgi:DNA-binding CsgD family transcriptional regulator